jgi:methyl-accepting chemotaxis protein
MEHIWESLSGLAQFSAVLISLIGLAFHIRWSRRATALGPTILTTLGIFFCFTGIAWGLVYFDPNDVRSGVPHLLQGIRTSFWSSVIGIFWALTLKIRVALFGDATVAAAGAREEATVDDLAALLAQVNRSMAGDDDSSLLRQVMLLRADSNERIDRLSGAFDKYAENIAEANSRALVSALSEVVRDFNAKINEQFGENFKHLNSGVERLVSWQDQYERQLQVLIERETTIRESMTEATSRFTDIVDRASEFAAVAAALRDIVGTLNNQSEQLSRALMQLSGLIGEVADGLPLVEQRIAQMIARSGQGSRPSQGAAPRSVAATG